MVLNTKRNLIVNSSHSKHVACVERFRTSNMTFETVLTARVTAYRLDAWTMFCLFWLPTRERCWHFRTSRYVLTYSPNVQSTLWVPQLSSTFKLNSCQHDVKFYFRTIFRTRAQPFSQQLVIKPRQLKHNSTRDLIATTVLKFWIQGMKMTKSVEIRKSTFRFLFFFNFFTFPKSFFWYFDFYLSGHFAKSRFVSSLISSFAANSRHLPVWIRGTWVAVRVS